MVAKATIKTIVFICIDVFLSKEWLNDSINSGPITNLQTQVFTTWFCSLSFFISLRRGAAWEWQTAQKELTMAKGNEGAEPFICRPFNNSINTHHTIRDRGNRLILGVKDDVRITADHLPSPTPHISDGGLPPMTLEEWGRLVNARVAQVRRHFSKRSPKMGARYACVTRAVLQRRHWSETGIPRSTFMYARKKVEDFFEALKMRPKPKSRTTTT